VAEQIAESVCPFCGCAADAPVTCARPFHNTRPADPVRPTKWRKKPVVIEAWQVDSQDYDDLCDLVGWCGGRAVGWDNHLIAIDTLEGTMYADNGDWIIRGVKGEFYPCKPDIFDATYEPEQSDGTVSDAAS
jgi:hypothetical protein